MPSLQKHIYDRFFYLFRYKFLNKGDRVIHENAFYDYVFENIWLAWYISLNFANINRILFKFYAQIYKIKWCPMILS